MEGAKLSETKWGGGLLLLTALSPFLILPKHRHRSSKTGILKHAAKTLVWRH